MKIVYMGTPDFAVGPLKALLADGHQIAAVLTRADKPKGRGYELSFTPVKEEALKHGIPVLFLNGYYKDLADFPYVVTDDRQGGYDATKTLIRKGHTKIAGIFKYDDRQGHDRYLGYASALIDHGPILSIATSNAA